MATPVRSLLVGLLSVLHVEEAPFQRMMRPFIPVAKPSEEFQKSRA
jgi:hypothetical protein